MLKATKDNKTDNLNWEIDAEIKNTKLFLNMVPRTVYDILAPILT